MPGYVDAFVLVVPKKNLAAYKKMSRTAGKVWREYGAVEYFECAGEDLKVQPGCGQGFPKLTRMKPGETVVFSWIGYKSRAHRDAVNGKVMKDPRIAKMMKGKAMPFDVKKMQYGGFEVIVDV
jgi:uncharacterized protein YbaA (DUF1428 family)